MRILLLLTSILFLASCGGNKHIKGYYLYDSKGIYLGQGGEYFFFGVEKDVYLKKDSLSDGTFTGFKDFILLNGDNAYEYPFKETIVTERFSGSKDSVYINLNLKQLFISTGAGQLKMSLIDIPCLQFNISSFDDQCRQIDGIFFSSPTFRFERNTCVEGNFTIGINPNLNCLLLGDTTEIHSAAQTYPFQFKDKANNTFDITIKNFTNDYFYRMPMINRYVQKDKDTLQIGEFKYIRIPDSIIEKHYRKNW